MTWRKREVWQQNFAPMLTCTFSGLPLREVQFKVEKYLKEWRISELILKTIGNKHWLCVENFKKINKPCRKKSTNCRAQIIKLIYSEDDLCMTMASIHLYFAGKQVGDTQKRGKPEMRSFCRKSLDLHWSASARLGRGPASVPHLRYLSVSRHFNE